MNGAQAEHLDYAVERTSTLPLVGKRENSSEDVQA